MKTPPADLAAILRPNPIPAPRASRWGARRQPMPDLEEWKRLARDAGYKARALARLRHVSDRHLRRQFLTLFVCPPQEWLDRVRLDDAKDRVCQGQPLKQIAVEVGFSSESHFCHHFKARTGLTPHEYAVLCDGQPSAMGRKEIGAAPDRPTAARAMLSETSSPQPLSKVALPGNAAAHPRCYAGNQ